MKTRTITLLSVTLLASLLLGTVALNMVSAPWGDTLFVWWNPRSYTLDTPVPDPWKAVLWYWGWGWGTAWTTPTDVYDACGEDSSHPASDAIDGSTWTYWRHSTTENHWITLDMGETMDITKIRIYQSRTSSYRWGQSDGIEVYVSDDPENWGPDVWTGTLNYRGWQQSGTFSAEGQYVKLVSRSTSSSQRLYEVQVQEPQGIDPSTILLEGMYTPVSEPYPMWWGMWLVAEFDGYDVLTALLLKAGHLSPGEQHCVYLEITAQLYDGTEIQGSGRIYLTIPEAPPP